MKLNAAQQASLHILLDPANPFDTDAGADVEVDIVGGQLVVNGAYLHSDGEWATYPESAPGPGEPGGPAVGSCYAQDNGGAACGLPRDHDGPHRWGVRT